MHMRGKWAILVTGSIIVSMVFVGYPVAACFGHTTSCEGESVYQGDGGATDEWHDDLYPPTHLIDPGQSTWWIITVKGGGGCSGYEHCTVTDTIPPSGWTTSIKMETIRAGSFHYIEPGNPPVNVGDDIEDREFYIGNNWDFDINYTISSPPTAPGGQQAAMVCTVYVAGFSPPNQHDWVYVHCTAAINAPKPLWAIITYPVHLDYLTGTETITWDCGPQSGLNFDIYLSEDDGRTFPYTVVLGLGDVRQYLWDTTTFPDGLHYQLKFVITDGTAMGYAYSEGIFTIDNYAPDPPTNLAIDFALTTSAEPTAKGSFDDTGNDLERIKKDDGNGYAVIKGKTMEMDTFNKTTQTDPVESAVLVVEYCVNDTGYTGTNSLWWKLESDVMWSDTGITPLDGQMLPVVATFDLYANGVDTVDKIANMNLMFMNDDGGQSQSVIFDYIWVDVKASMNDLGFYWDTSPSADISHYHIYRSPDQSSWAFAGETHATWWNDPGTAIDLSNYFYQVRSVDLASAEGLPSYTVAKYLTSLADGWNVASVPLAPTIDDSRGKVLQSIDGNYDTLQAYHAGYSRPWLHWYDTKPAHLNSLSTIVHEGGYYLKMQGVHDLISLGRVLTAPTIDLVAGWNLIGYPSLTIQSRDAALSTILPELNAVFKYDPVTDVEVEITGMDNMEPGMGYWIHVKSDCTLTL